MAEKDPNEAASLAELVKHQTAAYVRELTQDDAQTIDGPDDNDLPQLPSLHDLDWEPLPAASDLLDSDTLPPLISPRHLNLEPLLLTNGGSDTVWEPYESQSDNSSSSEAIQERFRAASESRSQSSIGVDPPAGRVRNPFKGHDFSSEIYRLDATTAKKILESARKAFVLNESPYAMVIRTMQERYLTAPFNGRIEYISGPMFSGKSTELLRRCRRLACAGMNVALIKPTQDTRSGDNVVKTHAGESMTAQFTAQTLFHALFLMLLRLEAKYQVIAIDEAQMFDDIIELVPALADAGFIVITAGCETTFERKPFKEYYKLSPLAESLTKLTAICKHCHADASFTRLNNNALASKIDANGLIIGGKETYEPVCRKCYISLEGNGVG